MILALDLPIKSSCLWDRVSCPFRRLSAQILSFAQSMDPLLADGIRKEVFTVLGLAASIIPPVYKAEATRRHGVMLREMIDCYFPWYKFVLLINFLLSLLGQYITLKDRWVYLFMAILVTVCYCVILLLASGFSEAWLDWYMGRFIKKKTRHLCKTPLAEQNEQQRNARIEFLADISEFLSTKIISEKTSYWQTSTSLRTNICSVANLILPVTKKRKKCCRQGEHTAQNSCRFQDEFTAFFSLPEEELNDFCKGLYYELPEFHADQKKLADHVELAGVFWKHILSPIDSMRAKANVVCRVYDALQLGEPGAPVTGRGLVLACGLIHCLYQEARMLEDGSGDPGSADYCARFLHEVRGIYLTDRPEPKTNSEHDDLISPKDIAEQICQAHIFLIWCISETELYLQAFQKTSHEATRIIQRYARDISSHVIWGTLYDDSIKFYLALAMCLIQRLPSPANKPVTLQQKRGLLNYVLYKKETIGGWNNVY